MSACDGSGRFATTGDLTSREAKTFIDYLEGRLRDQQKEEKAS
ncbi:hypothetical protein [Tessaracoccus massiliensis]|nr:hypothetical protein [Tessaracoccus massiliensis]